MRCYGLTVKYFDYALQILKERRMIRGDQLSGMVNYIIRQADAIGV